MEDYREVQSQLARTKRHLQAALLTVISKQNSEWPFDNEEVEFLVDSLAKVRAPLHELIGEFAGGDA